MSYLEKVIEYFNNKENFSQHSFIEFELKLLIDPRNKLPTFINTMDLESSLIKCRALFKYFKSLSKDPPINKQTINFINSISNTNESIIKELHFFNGIQLKQEKKVYTKTRLHSPVYISNKKCNFKLSLSSELITKVESSEYNLIRFKQRFTFPVEDWNIDFTFIKISSSKLVNTIKEIKDKLFININDVNIFTENLWIWNYADIIEIEFEYSNSQKPLQINNINNIINLL